MTSMKFVQGIGGGLRLARSAAKRLLGTPPEGDRSGSGFEHSMDVAGRIWPHLVGAGEGERPLGSVLFVAPDRECGHTMVAAATAATLAQHLREPIGIVELDYERPVLADVLGVEARAGVSEYLRGQCDVESAVVRSTEHPNLAILTGGSASPLEPGALSVAALERLRVEMENSCRTTIYVAPPLERCSDMRLLAGRVDGVVVALSAATTTKEQVAATLEVLEDARARLIGSVLTGYDFDLPGTAA